jgi:glutamine synthetase
MRLGDGSAAIHNAVASLLFAGIDGLDRKLELPPQCAKLPYEDEDTLGDPLPSSLTEALDALAADQYLSGQMGDRLIEIFQEIKRYELGRWEAELARVTDWERDEYAHHL